MEAVIPLFALSSLYLINNQNKKKDETEEFSNKLALPNTNVPDENYPVNSNETEQSSELSIKPSQSLSILSQISCIGCSASHSCHDPITQ